MEIAEQLVLLAELNRVENKIREKKLELEARPADAKAAQEKADAIKSELDALDKQRFDTERLKRQAEQDTAMEKDNLRKWQARADNIRGEREHAALNSEIGGLKRRITHLENDQLELMQKMEDIEQATVPKMEEHEAATTGAKEEWAKVEDDLARLKREIDEQEGVRQKMLEKLPDTLVARYNKIAEQRKGVGVAIIKGELCSQCRRTLPPQLCLQVYKGVVMETCPSCQRILVHEASTRSKAVEDAQNA